MSRTYLLAERFTLARWIEEAGMPHNRKSTRLAQDMVRFEPIKKLPHRVRRCLRALNRKRGYPFRQLQAANAAAIHMAWRELKRLTYGELPPGMSAGSFLNTPA